MEQSDLREWERRCVQEEPPFCQAACPLRVDARAFLDRMRAADFDAARRVLEKTLPLPGVLARICDHPCESSCKRAEAGGPLAIAALERVAASLGRPGQKPLVLPSTGRKAAVAGCGLAALTCAWDLARKGHRVTLFCPDDAPGGFLRSLPEALLPRAELDRELDRMQALGVDLRCAQTLTPNFVESLRAEFGAVFVEHPAPCCPPSRQDVDPVTLLRPDREPDSKEGAPLAGVFCGGWEAADHSPSPVRLAAEGRRAATSMDRHLTGASLTASREREGAGPTRLFTSLAGVAPLPRLAPADPEAGYAADEARDEAGRCLACQCLECVKACAYLETYKGYPKTYARQFYNNAAIVQGVHTANTQINSCSLCGLCEEVCPERFSMAELCLEVRRDMVARDKMPRSAHEFALLDMAESLGPHFALARPQPGRGPTCAHVFYPGCQLAASHPHHVENVYRHLAANLPGGVGLMLGCCGVPALWAGRDDLFAEAGRKFSDAWKALGRPRIVAACASCLSTFRKHLPEARTVFVWQALEEAGLPPRPDDAPHEPVALHDPCGLRHEDEARRAVRRVLAALGAQFEEIVPDGPFAECCGYGGLMSAANPPLGRAVAGRLARKSGRGFATTCAMCRDRLAAEGRAAHHALDFVFAPAGPAPDARGPGFSDRQENRARLKARLMRELWNESPPTPDVPPVAVSFLPEAQALMEDRFLLREDLIQVILKAQRTGRRFVHAESGRFLASARPRRVTFWVEYRAEGPGFTVLRAWSHRMAVEGPTGQPLEAGKGRVYLPPEPGWACACGQSLTPGVAKAEYLGSGFALTLGGCAACAQVLAPEALALGKMAEVERLLEDK